MTELNSKRLQQLVERSDMMVDGVLSSSNDQFIAQLQKRREALERQVEILEPLSVTCAEARSNQRQIQDEIQTSEPERRNRLNELAQLRLEVENLPKLIAAQEKIFAEARKKLDNVSNTHTMMLEKYRREERMLNDELNVYETQAGIRIVRDHGSLKYIFNIDQNEYYMLMSMEICADGRKIYRLLDCRPSINIADVISYLNEGKLKIGGCLAIVRRRFKQAAGIRVNNTSLSALHSSQYRMNDIFHGNDSQFNKQLQQQQHHHQHSNFPSGGGIARGSILKPVEMMP
eukprot:GDKJ01018766.1.p1 GENE.GDKJ01018766.1~~GDKJ01018766.1.p1  ORF type:complete len:288 (-),score=54.59 GDKJ01018766.1:112-975(-)